MPSAFLCVWLVAYRLELCPQLWAGGLLVVVQSGELDLSRSIDLDLHLLIRALDAGRASYRHGQLLDGVADSSLRPVFALGSSCGGREEREVEVLAGRLMVVQRASPAGSVRRRRRW